MAAAVVSSGTTCSEAASCNDLIRITKIKLKLEDKLQALAVIHKFFHPQLMVVDDERRKKCLSWTSHVI
jgi:hypothetical protein